MTARTGWGVLGCARIATDEILPAIGDLPEARLHAVASRDPDRARAVATRFGATRHYGKYGDLVADPDVDAVYIPLPNHLHAKWATEALRAGKAVLVEKPGALSLTEARQLVACARDRNLVIGEASMFRFRRQWAFLERWLSDNLAPGESALTRVHVGYDITTRTAPGEFRLEQRIGGGALLDVGTYAITAASALFGRAKSATLTQFQHSSGPVDGISVGSLAFEANRVLAFTCDFHNAWVDTPLEVRTRLATVRLDHAFNPGLHPSEAHILRQGHAPDIRKFDGENAYATMLAEFSRNMPAGSGSTFAQRQAENLLTSAHNLSLLVAHNTSAAATES
jgi:predicted dehydrogenase